MRSIMIMAVVVCAGAGPSAMAGIQFQSLGKAVPPAALGPSSMAVLPGLPDTSALSSLVTTAPLSSQTSLSFLPGPMTHLAAPPWWGRSYNGSVYDSGSATSMTLVPFGSNQIDALVLYVVPNAYGVFNVSLTGSDGSSSVTATDAVNGLPHNLGTAVGWAFYGTGTSKVTSLTISCDVPFTIGEFYYHNPSPGAAAMLGLAAVGRGRRRSR